MWHHLEALAACRGKTRAVKSTKTTKAMNATQPLETLRSQSESFFHMMDLHNSRTIIMGNLQEK
jgi:hypothetical protein